MVEVKQKVKRSRKSLCLDRNQKKVSAGRAPVKSSRELIITGPKIASKTAFARMIGTRKDTVSNMVFRLGYRKSKRINSSTGARSAV